MKCPICHGPLKGEPYCPNCGQAITYEGIEQKYLETTLVPNEIKGWNWGAFSFNIFWGIGNKTYLPLLCLIPYFGFIWIFVCGFKGNEWAWKKGNYSMKDIGKFLTIQKTWNRGGIARFIIGLIGITLLFILNMIIFTSLINLYYYY